MSVDIEALVVNFLRAQPSVTAIVADNIYTDMPHTRPYPVVIVNRSGGGALYKNHLEAAEVTISAYGGTHKVAYNLANECLSTMSSALVGAHPEGCVTKVKAEAVTYEPEPDSTDPQGHGRPRFTVNVVVTAHP